MSLIVEPIVCVVCGDRFNSVRIHLDKNKKPTLCTVCRRSKTGWLKHAAHKPRTEPRDYRKSAQRGT